MQKLMVQKLNSIEGASFRPKINQKSLQIIKKQHRDNNSADKRLIDNAEIKDTQTTQKKKIEDLLQWGKSLEKKQSEMRKNKQEEVNLTEQQEIEENENVTPQICQKSIKIVKFSSKN